MILVKRTKANGQYEVGILTEECGDTVFALFHEERHDGYFSSGEQCCLRSEVKLIPVRDR